MIVAQIVRGFWIPEIFYGLFFGLFQFKRYISKVSAEIFRG